MLHKRVLTFSDGERHGDDSVATGKTVKAADEVGQVVQHRQVVLDDDDEAEQQQGTNL